MQAPIDDKKMWQRMRGFIEDENFGWGASDNDIEGVQEVTGG